MNPSRSFRRWVVVMVAALGIGGAAQARAVSAGTAAVSKGRDAMARPRATGTIPTTITQYLCAGPTPACPATGPVLPPYTPALTMSYGQDWNGTVEVTAQAGGPAAPTGNINITWSYNGGAPILECTLPVATGGQCPAALGTTEGTSLGMNAITASYTGDSNFAPSSSTIIVTVLQDTTLASLVGSPNPSPAGQPVTLTATMTGSNAPPTGPVTFSLGNTVIGTANLVAGTGTDATATMTTSTLPVGQDLITATYTGTADFAGASATWTETITPSLAGSFTLSVTPNPVNVGVGFGALLSVTVTPMDGFSQDVNLSCANLPQEATCLFVPATVSGGNGKSTLIVQTAAPHSCGTNTPYFLGRDRGLSSMFPRRAFTFPALAGIFTLLLPFRRRRWLKLLIALVAVIGATQISGCGNCTDLGTRPATYSIEVTGTAAQGGAGSGTTASQAVTISVTI